MKLLVELSNKNNLNLNCTGFILPLKDYSVESTISFTMEEIENIINKYNKEIFIKINKNLFNKDISIIKDILIKLDKLNVKGIFFYDLAILQLVKELNLNIDLIWSQTHMVNNYKTCNYYYSKGVKYALLGKELTLNEIKEIIKLSKINCMVEVISKPSVAVSHRRLITNYFQALGKNSTDKLQVMEKISNLKFNLIENNNDTSFFLDTITNGTSIIKDLYVVNCPYIIIREYGIGNFRELISDTMKYISNGCIDNCYIKKYEKLGDSTNFFFKKTIYKVK